MHDLRRQRALARIAKIRAAQRDAAHQELLLAGERERDAEVTCHRADEATFAAAADWQNELATGGFSPELAGALAFALNQRVLGSSPSASTKLLNGLGANIHPSQGAVESHVIAT